MPEQVDFAAEYAIVQCPQCRGQKTDWMRRCKGCDGWGYLKIKIAKLKELEQSGD